MSANKKESRSIRSIESELTYKSLFEATTTSNSIFDLEYRLILQNAISKKELGQVENPIGQTVHELFGDSIGQLLSERMQHVIETGEPASYDTKFDLPTGQKWFTSSYQPVYSHDNKIIAVQIISQNTTKLKEADANEKKFQTIFNTLSEGVALNEIVYNDQGEMIDYTVVEVNKAYFNFVELPESVVLGNRASVIYGMTDEMIKSFWLYHKEQTETVTTEMKSPIDDRHFLISTSPIFDHKFITVFFEISQIKEKEKELIIAKEKAEESDRLKTAFLANMSHEIRTPMNAILGFSDLLMQKNLSDEKKEKYLELINTGGKNLLNIISDIIDISKMDANQIHINNEVCNINHVFDNLLSQFTILLAQSPVTLQMNKTLDDHAATILTDETRLTQILSNLIENARKFTKEGSIHVGYVLKQNNLEFFVKDTGIGINEKDFKLIFERFGQIKNEQTRSISGTGLGLSIAKGLVELLGGAITVESEQGTGTTFTFTIPYNRVYEHLSIEQTQSNNSIPNLQRTILIAEDEYSNFIYLEELLSDYSFKILHAHNGREAIDLLKHNTHVDMILMDIKMPLMNGLEATAEIRKFNSNIPIVAQTAYAMADDNKKAIAAGCNEYLTKPLSMLSLAKIFDKYFSTQ